MKVTLILIVLVSTSAFGFCPSKSAERKIVELFERSSARENVTVENMQYVQFMNISETEFNYVVVWDKTTAQGLKGRMLSQVNIDAEDPECKVLHVQSESMRFFEEKSM